MPISIGRLDWTLWLYGLITGFIAGGSGAVSAAFGLMVTDPAHYNIGQPLKIFEVMAWTFVLPGFIAAFAYLKQNPLPIEIKTTTTTTTLQNNPPAIIEKKIETTEAKPE